jgi:hypothetical protein
VAPSPAVVAVCFIAAGYGAGLLLVHERLLIQVLVPDELSGRIFGVRDALTAWAWAIAFVAAPVLLNWLGTRATVVLAGCGAFTVWLVAALVLRRAAGRDPDQPGAGGPLAGGGVGGGDLAWPGRAGEHGPDLVSR